MKPPVRSQPNKETMKLKILTLASTILLAFTLTACGGNGAEPGESAATAEGADHEHAEEADHEHGVGTHTHEAAADTAGTYADTTGAFFSEDDSAAADHAHGPDTHEH